MKAVDQRLIRSKIIEGLPYNDVIYSTAAGPDGKIYMGVSNEFNPETFASIFSYDPRIDGLRQIVDLRLLFPEGEDLLRPPHSKIHTAMCVGPDGKVYAASHLTAPPRGETIHRCLEIFDDPRRGYTGSHAVIYDPATAAVTDLGVVAPREGCRFLTLNPEREELYMVTYPRAHFVVINTRTGESKDLGRISQYDAIGPCWSACGYAFTTDDRGFLLRYDPKHERIERLPVQVPDAPWRDGDGNRLRRIKVGPDGVKLYGVGFSAVRVFEYDPTVGEYGQMRDLGNGWGDDPFNGYSLLPPVKGLTFGRDGRIYMAVGQSYTADIGNIDNDPGSHIVAKDIQTGEIEDFGLMQVGDLPPPLFCQDATTGTDGTMYFGTAFLRRHRVDPLQLIMFNPDGFDTPAAAQRKWTPSAAAAMDQAGNDPDILVQCEQDKMHDVFVTEGSFVVRELGWEGRTPIVPEGECAITALVRATGGAIYGATSGTRCHVIRPGGLGKVADLGTVGATEQACRALVAVPSGMVYGGTMSPGMDDYVGGHLFRLDPRTGTGLRGGVEGLPLPPQEGQIEDLGILVPGQGIWALTVDPERNRLYGLTEPRGMFFIYDLDTGEVDVRQSLTAKHISRALICDGEGNVYGSRQQGCLFRYAPDRDALEALDVRIPCGRGRDYLNCIDALVRTADGTIYGGTSDGFLFRLHPDTATLVNLGKPCRQERIRAMTVGNDGLIWGIAGEEDGLAHLFRHEPATGESVDLGVPCADMPKRWAGYEFDAMVTGADGEIYMGESDRVSHLFTYYPPIRPICGAAPSLSLQQHTQTKRGNNE